MKHFLLKDMTNGWFVGDFSPTSFRTSGAEVAVKKYRAGETDHKHFHKIATEITLILSGSVSMNKNTYRPGDIIVLDPFEINVFNAITDVTLVVVKVPGAKNDKYTI